MPTKMIKWAIVLPVWMVITTIEVYIGVSILKMLGLM